MKIDLAKPFKSSAGGEQGFVNLRPSMTVGDWRHVNKAGGSAEERLFAMVCRLSGLLPEECDQLSMADFNKIVEQIDTGDTDPKG